MPPILHGTTSACFGKLGGPLVLEGDITRRYQRQSRAGERGVVLVVSKVRAGGLRFWKGLRRTHETQRKACELIHRGGYSIPQSIQVSKEGFQPQTVSVQRGFRTGALIQDFIPGLLAGPIPLLVDAISGDWWYVANSSYHVHLHPIHGSVSSARPEMK